MQACGVCSHGSGTLGHVSELFLHGTLRLLPHLLVSVSRLVGLSTFWLCG